MGSWISSYRIGFLLVGILSLPGWCKYGGGTGEASDPYLIYDPCQMNMIGADPCDWDKCFKLMADIDLSNYSSLSYNFIGDQFTPFTGSFDGNGHTISNFTYYFPLGGEDFGLFGRIADPCAVVKDLTLSDPCIILYGDTNVGSLVGLLEDGTITGCSAEGVMVRGGINVGGLVGANYDGFISNCSTEGKVAGCADGVGGLVGFCIDSSPTGDKEISDCYAKVEIVSIGENSSVGGLVGSNKLYNIYNCRAEGSVRGSGGGIGGLVGSNQNPVMIDSLKIINCSAKVEVVGEGENSSYIGGLVGYNEYCSIINCQAEGSVTASGDYIGGLIGNNSNPTMMGGMEIINCNVKAVLASNGDSSEFIGGLVGYNMSCNICNCKAEGTVTTNGNYIGGLIGINSDAMMTGDSEIVNCYTDVEIMNDSYTSSYVGGLVGMNGSKISNCQAKGDVTTNSSTVGGLVGSQMMMTSGEGISNCCATGDVAGNTYVGGLVGMNNSPMGGTIIKYCYATGKVTGGDPCMPPSMFMVGGLVGSSMMGGVTESFWDVESSGITTSSGGEGLSTAEMQTRSTYIDAGWDFTRETGNGGQDIWLIEDGLDYPQLAGQYKYGGGEGVESDPYLIYTVTEMSLVGDKPEGHFRLMGDVDFENYVGGCYGMIGEYPDYPFSGVFDGNGYMIKNFSYETSAHDFVGLFGYVEGENAEIKNLMVNNIEIEAGTGDYAGGVAGYNYGGRITNVYVTGTVSGWGGVGGLAGVNYDGIVSRCGANCMVEGYEDVGGLVGTNCYQISNCLAAGNVLGMRFAGGLVGYNWDGSIINSYNSGQAIGLEYWGGLVGYNNGGTLGNSFWDGQIGGLNNGFGTALTTEEMQDPCTFIEAGWDFVGETENGTEDIWRMCGEGLDYPHLAWKHTTRGDFICPDGVEVNDLAYFMEWWLAGECGSYEDCMGADLNKDGRVDIRDFAVVGQNWMDEF